MVAADQALARDVSRDSLLAVVEGQQGNDRRGAGASGDRLRRWRSRSVAESVSRVMISRTGAAPAPVPQFRVEVDGLVVAAATSGGRTGTSSARSTARSSTAGSGNDQSPEDVMVAQNRRQESIRQAGFWVTRWGWAQARSVSAADAPAHRARRGDGDLLGRLHAFSHACWVNLHLLEQARIHLRGASVTDGWSVSHVTRAIGRASETVRVGGLPAVGVGAGLLDGQLGTPAELGTRPWRGRRTRTPRRRDGGRRSRRGSGCPRPPRTRARSAGPRSGCPCRVPDVVAAGGLRLRQRAARCPAARSTTWM